MVSHPPPFYFDPSARPPAGTQLLNTLLLTDTKDVSEFAPAVKGWVTEKQKLGHIQTSGRQLSRID